jgi:hypothetical protein
MSDYLTRSAVAGVALEAVPGVSVMPAYASDLLALEGLEMGGNYETTATDEYTGSLDKSPDIPAGGTRPVKATALLKGAGLALAAAGTAPAYGRLLEACSMVRHALPAAVAGTVTQATANTVTLSSVAGLAKGMPITIAGQRRVIAGVAGAVATIYPALDPVPADGAAFTVPAGNVYRAASTGLKNATIARWRRSVSGGPAKLSVAPGCAGTFSVELAARGVGRINFELTGGLLPDVEIADPGEPVFQPGAGLPWLGAASYFGGRSTNPVKLDIALGGTVQMADDPRAVTGYGAGRVADRQWEVKITPPLGLASERNEFARWLDRAPRDFWTVWGEGPGSDISIYLPGLVNKTGPEELDVKGIMHEGLTLQSSEVNGGLYLWVG